MFHVLMYNPSNCRVNSTTQCCPMEINIDDELESEGDDLDNEWGNHTNNVHFLGHHFLGNIDIKCPNCSALHQMDEKLSHSSPITPHFGNFCLQGKVKLPLLETPPPVI